MATARRELGLSGLILEPTLRHDHCAVAGEDGIDLGHIGLADLPAERARFSRTSAGVRKPTNAVPTTGLLNVQRNANCGRVFSYFAARRFRSSTAARLRGNCSGPNKVRNRVRLPRFPAFERQSLSSKDIPEWIVPLSIP